MLNVCHHPLFSLSFSACLEQWRRRGENSLHLCERSSVSYSGEFFMHDTVKHTMKHYTSDHTHVFISKHVVLKEKWYLQRSDCVFAGMTMLLSVIVFCRNNCIYPWLCFTGMTMLLSVIVFCRNNCIYPWLCFAGMTMLLSVIVFCRNDCIYPWLCFTGSWSLRGSFSWTVTSVWWSLTQQPRVVRSSRLSRPRSAWGLTLSASASTRSWAAQVCSLAVPRVYTKGKWQVLRYWWRRHFNNSFTKIFPTLFMIFEDAALMT